jgi:hypothetical protein
MKLLSLITTSLVTVNLLCASVLDDINVDKSLNSKNRDFNKIRSVYILQDKNTEKLNNSKNSLKKSFNYSTTSLLNENELNSHILYINAEKNNSSIYIVEARENSSGKLFTIEKEFKGYFNPDILVETRIGKQSIHSFLEENLHTTHISFNLVYDDNIISSYNGNFNNIAPLLYELNLALTKSKNAKLSSPTYNQFANVNNFNTQKKANNVYREVSTSYTVDDNFKKCSFNKLKLLETIEVREKPSWNSAISGLEMKKNTVINVGCNAKIVSGIKGHKWVKVNFGYLPMPSLKDNNKKPFTEVFYEN